MIFLALSILSSIGIFLVFRMFKSYELNTRHGILVNYLVAGLTGLIAFMPGTLWFDKDWFLPSFLLGAFFYVIFRVMARVTQVNGLSLASIATKMSVVIPVAVGLLVLDESWSWLKGLGIMAGLVAIVLSAGGRGKINALVWPLVLFMGSGIIDASLKLFQHYLVSAPDYPVFISTIFIAAFVTAAIHHLFTKDQRISKGAVFGGTVLGIVNFAALFFIIKTLALPDWESSVVFPINNFGIIAGSTAIAVLAMRERLSLTGWIGFFLATASIVVLYLSK